MPIIPRYEDLSKSPGNMASNLILTPKNDVMRKTNQGFTLVKNQDIFYPKDQSPELFDEASYPFGTTPINENGILTPIKPSTKDLPTNKKLQTESKHNI